MRYLDFINDDEVKVTKLSILKELKQNIEHNVLCYSVNYLMTQPKESYVNEWERENKKLILVEEMIKDEKEKNKEKNKENLYTRRIDSGNKN